LKAIYYTQYGNPDVLQLKEVAKPDPKHNEVLVKVRAASINSWDWDMVRGKPWIVRMWGLFKPKYKIPGCDIAGIVEAVGRDVTKFKVGDEVYGDMCESGFGAFAEYKCAKENALALKPAGMSFVQAASIPQAAMLAVQSLRDKAKIRAGQTLLIKGGGGGVGIFAVQIAKLAGAEVTGVDSESKFEMMRSLGYDHLIDYTKEDFTTSEKRYDIILDVNTNRPITHFTRVLNRHGMYLTVGGSLGKFFLGLLLKPWISLFSKKGFHLVAMKANKDLPYMNELFEAGQLKPVIEGPYKLEDAAEAFRFFSTGEHKGKIVMTIGGNKF